MPVLKIELDGEGKFPQLQGKKVHKAGIEVVTALPGGMSSGRTSVALLIPLDDGSYVFAETSLANFQMAAAALTGRYGNET